MAITSGGSGATETIGGLYVDVYILRKFVEMTKDNLCFAKYSEPAQIPRNSGAYVARWNVPVAETGSTTVITEASAGTVGELTATSINNVEGTINIYGEFMKIGEIAEEAEPTAAMDAYAEQFAFRGASAIDSLLYTQAKTSTNFLHSGDKVTGGATLAATNYATISDFPAIAGHFHGQNAKGFRDLNGDYVWIMHPNQAVDLESEATTNFLNWANVHQGTAEGYDQLIRNHQMVGRYAGVCAIRSTVIGTITEDVTAHQSIALARFGLGWAGLAETGPKAPEIIRKRPGPNDTSQPLNLYQTLAWKVRMAAKLVDAARVLVVYSAED